MRLQSDLVAGAVREELAVTRLGDEVACGGVDLGEEDARLHDRLGSLLGCEDHLVHLALLGRGLRGEEGARHVGAVLVHVAAHVEEEHVALLEHGAVGGVVRVGSGRAEAHDGCADLVVAAQLAVLRGEHAGDLALGHALVYLQCDPGHCLVVDAARAAHELLLVGILDGAGVVHRGRSCEVVARRAGLHEREQPASGHVLVDPQGRAVIADAGEHRDRVVGVGEGDHVLAERRRIGEELVAEHDVALGREVEPVEALHGLVVVTAQVADRDGIADEDLGEAHLLEVGEHLVHTLLVHVHLLGRVRCRSINSMPRSAAPSHPLAAGMHGIAHRRGIA